jgi:hypothetical protein
MPALKVYINCDTRFAINLRAFDLGENDEFIFVIKNYNYIDSTAVFTFRASKKDEDSNGEVLFKITPEASKNLKPGAFYNFSVLINAFDDSKETEYRKLTDNGKILIEYGAQDLELKSETNSMNDIVGIRLEPINESEED